jgi:hypothetical protein
MSNPVLGERVLQSKYSEHDSSEADVQFSADHIRAGRTGQIWLDARGTLRLRIEDGERCHESVVNLCKGLESLHDFFRVAIAMCHTMHVRV